MTAKKIPISINEGYEKDILGVGKLIGINTSHYGYIPKILRFSILYTLSNLKSYDNIIPDMPAPILENFLSSIRIMKMQKIHDQEKEKSLKIDKKYNQTKKEAAVSIENDG